MNMQFQMRNGICISGDNHYVLKGALVQKRAGIDFLVYKDRSEFICKVAGVGALHTFLGASL
jgi:hypothetical protein